MNDVIEIELQPGERLRLEDLAHRQGYDTSSQFVRALLWDMLDEDTSLDDAIESFRQGWRDMLRGDVMTLDEMWKYVERDHF